MLTALRRVVEAIDDERENSCWSLDMKLALMAVVGQALLIGYRLVEDRFIHDSNGCFGGFQGGSPFWVCPARWFHSLTD